jgi:hypothetical protein
MKQTLGTTIADLNGKKQGEHAMIQFLKPWVMTALFLFGVRGFAFADGLDVSVRGGYFYYGEPDAEISYSGPVTGIRGAYEKNFSWCLVQIRSEIMSGSLTYDGSLNTHLAEGATPGAPAEQTRSVRYDASLWYSDSSILMGGSFMKKNFEIRPLIGLGYRYLENPENAQVPFDYERRSTSFYVPLVLEFRRTLSERRFWGFSGEMDFLLRGSTRAKLSDASDQYNDLEFNQSKGVGARLTGFYQHEWMGLSLSVKPFVDVWMVDESDTDVLEFGGTRVLVKSADGTYGDYREPANITLAGGLELALYF